MAFKSTPTHKNRSDEADKIWDELNSLYESITDPHFKERIYRAKGRFKNASIDIHGKKFWLEKWIKLNRLQNMMDTMSEYYHTTLQLFNSQYLNYDSRNKQVPVPVIAEDEDMTELLIHGYFRNDRIPIDIMQIIVLYVNYLCETTLTWSTFDDEPDDFFGKGFEFRLFMDTYVWLEMNCIPEYVSECTVWSAVRVNGELRAVSIENCINEYYKKHWAYYALRFSEFDSKAAIKCNLKILAIKYKNGKVSYNRSIKMRRSFEHNVKLDQHKETWACLDNKNWCYWLSPRRHMNELIGIDFELKLLQLPLNVGKVGVKLCVEYEGGKDRKIEYFTRKEFQVERIIYPNHVHGTAGCAALGRPDFYKVTNPDSSIRISVRILSVFDDAGQYIASEDWKKYGVVD